MTDLYKEYEDKLPRNIIDSLKEKLPVNVSQTRLKKILDAVLSEYKSAKADPGESVGLVSAESIGEPGTQMSIDYEEEVIVKSQNKITIAKIGEFIDKIMSKRICHKINNDTEVCDLSGAELFVPSLSQNEKVEWKKVTALSRHSSPEKLLRITTRSGRQITATPYHSFVIRNNNEILPIAGDALKIGDRIPTIKRLVNLSNNEFLKLEDYLPKTEYIYESALRKAINKAQNFELPIKSYEQINNYAQGNNKFQLMQNCVYMYQNHSLGQIPEVLELDYLFGFFIGAYLAEGTHTKHYIGITNVSEQYLQQIIKFAEKYNINYNIKYEIGEYSKSTTLLLYSTLIADLVNKSCGNGAYNKYAPEFAYSAKSEFISGLLGAYFGGDGNINVMRKVIRASSCSKKLIDGIALLLSQFGIYAVKSKASKKQYVLSIFNEQNRSYDIIDMFAGYGDILSKLGKRSGVPSRLTNKFTKKQKIGRHTLKKYTSLFESIAKEKNIPIDNELKILKRMLNSDVVWDEIIKLEYVEPTKGYVYDFSVEDLETFTTFDGIITHNTLNTFHFAGVAEMNVTMGLPRIIEILDGRHNISTPMMEIYLKKPYSTGTDIKKIALQIKETLLRDIVTEVTINMLEYTIEIKYDKEKIKEIGISEGMIEKELARALKGFSIKFDNNLIIIKSRGKEININEIYKLKEKVKEIHIKGIKGITQVLPVKRGEEYVIITSGSNLYDVLNMEFVDSTRTTTNNVLEIADILGIEAARQAIINEVYKVIESQGLNVDIRHIMLVADTMCVSGHVKGITRYGIVSEKPSVLARASFETPIKHIINASLIGKLDTLNSVVENIMLNQPVPVGTGLPGLVTKIRK